MKGLLKWPLIIAAVIVVLRVVFEQNGVPDSINNLLSVVILYVFIAPLYFAYHIAKSGDPKPYRTLMKLTALFTALARAIVIPTYWLAYIYQWPQPRFSVAQGGNVGPDVTPVMGYFVIPFAAAAAWVIVSLIAGGGLGSILIAVMRKKVAQTT